MFCPLRQESRSVSFNPFFHFGDTTTTTDGMTRDGLA